MVRFREIGATWLKSFNADFGTNIVHQFTVGSAQSTSSNTHPIKWEIFPNPTKDKILIEGFSDEKTQISVLNNLGERVIKTENIQAGFTSKNIDLSKLSKGIYFVKIQNEDKEYPSNTGQKWTDEEEKILLEELNKNIDIELISVKATTYEKLDAIGNQLAIAAESVVLLKKV